MPERNLCYQAISEIYGVLRFCINVYLSTKGRPSLITFVQLILTRVFEVIEDLINFVDWRLKRRTKGFNEGQSISFALGSNKGRLGSSFCKHKKSMF